MTQMMTDRVAEELWRCEAEIAVAMHSTGGFLQTLLAAEGEANLSAVVGASTLHHLGSTISALTTARSELSQVHRQLERMRVNAGLALETGPGGDKYFARISNDPVARIEAA